MKHEYFFIIMFILFSGWSKIENKVTAQTATRDVTKDLVTFLQDTMFLNGRSSLKKIPDSQGEEIKTLNRCTVFVLEKKPVPNIRTTNVVDTFVKVRTTEYDTGYIWKKVLITLSHLRARNDSLAMWKKQPMPLYKNLVGTSYYRNDELPFELSSGAFISVGENNRYGILSVYNRYTDRFSYLFFVESTGRIRDERDNELKIHAIIPLDWEKFGSDAQPWFRQCECVNQEDDCSEIVAVYEHTTEMAKQGILVTPLKAWRPDYSKRTLIEIDVKTVRCGSMPPEEYDDDDFPG